MKTCLLSLSLLGLSAALAPYARIPCQDPAPAPAATAPAPAGEIDDQFVSIDNYAKAKEQLSVMCDNCNACHDTFAEGKHQLTK